MALGTVQVAEFSEPEELTTALPGVLVRATPLCGGRFRASIAGARLGNVILQCGACSPLAFTAVAGPATAVLQLPLENREALILNGRTPGPGSVGTYGAGAELLRANPRPCTFASLMMPADAVEALLCPPVGARMFAPSMAQFPVAGAEAWDRLAGTVSAAAALMATDPEVLDREPARNGLRASLLEAGRIALAGADEPVRRGGMWHRWRRIVVGAEAYLHADVARPVYTEELCAALGVSAATLAEAFRAAFGLSPHRYLKQRRLAMVRAALRATDGSPPLVKSVALSHGFWHLGQFAHDYRAMYDETPSETLARAHQRRTAGGTVTLGQHDREGAVQARAVVPGRRH